MKTLKYNPKEMRKNNFVAARMLGRSNVALEIRRFVDSFFRFLISTISTARSLARDVTLPGK